MPRSMVGLLAAAVAAMSVLATLAHGHLFWAILLILTAAAYLVGYATAPELPFSTGLTDYLALHLPKKSALYNNLFTSYLRVPGSDVFR